MTFFTFTHTHTHHTTLPTHHANRWFPDQTFVRPCQCDCCVASTPTPLDCSSITPLGEQRCIEVGDSNGVNPCTWICWELHALEPDSNDIIGLLVLHNWELHLWTLAYSWVQCLGYYHCCNEFAIWCENHYRNQYNLIACTLVSALPHACWVSTMHAQVWRRWYT